MPVSVFSKPITYSKYIEPFNLDLAQKALLYKQNKYDQGVQQTQETINKLGGLDVYADTDKEYLQQKMGMLTDNVNKLSGMDFSDRNTLGKINSLSSLITGDERIINAISDTSSIKGLFTSAQKLDEKGKYSQSNKFYDTKAVNAYLEEKKRDPNARYKGAASATQFHDVNKKLTDYAAKVAAAQAKGEKQTVLGDGYIVSVSGASSAELMASMRGALTADEQRQLEIDGQYKYQGVTSEELKKTLIQGVYTNYKGLEQDALNAKKMYESSPVGSVPYEENKKKYEDFVKMRDTDITTTLKNLNSYSEDQLRGLAHTTDTFNSISNAFDNKSVKYKADTALFMKERIKIDVNKEEQRRKEDERDYLYKVNMDAQKLALDKERLALQKSKADGTDANGKSTAVSSDPTYVQPTTPIDNTSGYTEFIGESKKIQDSKQAVAAQYIGNFLRKNNIALYNKISDTYGEGNIFDDKGQVRAEIIPVLTQSKLGTNLSQIIQTASANREARIQGKDGKNHPVSYEEEMLLNRMAMIKNQEDAWNKKEATTKNQGIVALQAELKKTDVPFAQFKSDVLLIEKVKGYIPADSEASISTSFMGMTGINNATSTFNMDYIRKNRIPITEAEFNKYNAIKGKYPSDVQQRIVRKKQDYYNNNISKSQLYPSQGVGDKIDATTQGFLKGQLATLSPELANIPFKNITIDNFTYYQNPNGKRDVNKMTGTYEIDTKEEKNKRVPFSVTLPDRILNNKSFFGGNFSYSEDVQFAEDLKHTKLSPVFSAPLADGTSLGYRFQTTGGDSTKVDLYIDLGDGTPPRQVQGESKTKTEWEKVIRVWVQNPNFKNRSALIKAFTN